MWCCVVVGCKGNSMVREVHFLSVKCNELDSSCMNTIWLSCEPLSREPLSRYSRYKR